MFCTMPHSSHRRTQNTMKQSTTEQKITDEGKSCFALHYRDLVPDWCVTEQDSPVRKTGARSGARWTTCRRWLARWTAGHRRGQHQGRAPRRKSDRVRSSRVLPAQWEGRMDQGSRAHVVLAKGLVRDHITLSPQRPARSYRSLTPAVGQLYSCQLQAEPRYPREFCRVNVLKRGSLGGGGCESTPPYGEAAAKLAHAIIASRARTGRDDMNPHPLGLMALSGLSRNRPGMILHNPSIYASKN